MRNFNKKIDEDLKKMLEKGEPIRWMCAIYTGKAGGLKVVTPDEYLKSEFGGIILAVVEERHRGMNTKEFSAYKQAVRSGTVEDFIEK